MEPETSSSDEDSEHSSEEFHAWHDRLKQERTQFDPSVVGPFGVTVVVTGSNDLKSAFFSFLLRGKDLEFRCQVQLRGGGCAMELKRVLEVLNRGMQMLLQTLRELAEKVAALNVMTVIMTLIVRRQPSLLQRHHYNHPCSNATTYALGTSILFRFTTAEHSIRNKRVETDGGGGRRNN
jgi:hypothetical protein